MEMNAPLLQVKDLKTYFFTDEGVAPAVDGVSYEVAKGKTLGLVGESGCGKSVSTLSIMRLIQEPPGKIVSGEINFNGRNLLTLSKNEMRRIRGNSISMIFQEPMTSLNPVFTCGDQIQEAIILHQHVSKKEARTRTIDMLRKVGIPAPEMRVDEYPHQLSGGMRQRVMIAMALSCNPSLLIADEPTTALDVTIQAQILDLLRNLRDEFQMGVIMITHDLGVIAELADHVVVMYAGRVAEYGSVKDIFNDPKHPYTEGLLHSIPKLTESKEKLSVIPGIVPNPITFPRGCRFHPRCPFVIDVCKESNPGDTQFTATHKAACWKYTPKG